MTKLFSFIFILYQIFFRLVISFAGVVAASATAVIAAAATFIIIVVAASATTITTTTTTTTILLPFVTLVSHNRFRFYFVDDFICACFVVSGVTLIRIFLTVVNILFGIHRDK